QPQKRRYKRQISIKNSTGAGKCNFHANMHQNSAKPRAARLKPRAFFEIFFCRFEQGPGSAAKIAPYGTNTPSNRRLQTISCLVLSKQIYQVSESAFLKADGMSRLFRSVSGA
ncbi:MAG: hypothetical protein QF806_02910, partial [Pseudomonadales bacterium]|nr:hypothetical protein [Pseudomonadales bacterium]